MSVSFCLSNYLCASGRRGGDGGKGVSSKKVDEAADVMVQTAKSLTRSEILSSAKQSSLHPSSRPQGQPEIQAGLG